MVFAHAAAETDNTTTPAPAPSGLAKKILSIQPVIDKDSFTLHIVADGRFKDYSSFRTSEPPGVVVEVPNVGSVTRSLWFFDNPLVKNIQIRTSPEGKVRIVFALFPIADLPYRVFSQDSRLTVALGAAAALSPKKPARKSQKAPAASTPAKQKAVPIPQAKKIPAKPATRITSVELKTVGPGVNVHILANGKLSPYRTFQLSGPPRLVVDLAGVHSDIGKQTLPSHNPLVKRVRLATFSKNIIRVVIDIGPPEVPPYQIIPGITGLVVAMKPPSVVPVQTSAPDTAPASATPAEKKADASPPPKQSTEEPSPAAPPDPILLHVGSFSHKGNARKEVQRLGKHDHKSFLVERIVSGQTWFRVYIGHFKDKQEAAQTGREFKKKGLITYYKVVIDRDITRTGLTPIK
ncbi:MAG: AMIN domain-containing protein [Desulfobacterales bacterium]